MNRLLISSLPLAALLLAGCGFKSDTAAFPQPQPTPPATAVQVSDELELANIKLTEKAEKRLGVTVAPVKREKVSKQRPYPAVAVVPPQSQTQLLAPVAGEVQYTGSGPLVVGTAVRKGEPLFSLTPTQTQGDFVMGPAQLDQLNASRIAVEQSAAAIATRIAVAEAQVKGAQIELDRSRELFEAKVGSRKRVDEATIQMNIARETLEATRRESKTLRKVDQIPQRNWAPSAVAQYAPLSGSILRVLVSSGQTVSQGQPMLELVDLNRVWLRVRIPLAEGAAVEPGESIEVSTLGRQLLARSVKGPPTADATTSTVDLYYELDNTLGQLSPDQRVNVSLPLKGSGEHLVVPSGAILHDIHGGAWVYVCTKPHEYHRVRVVVDRVGQDGRAVLAQGPEPGVQVVVDGAAEIFGFEFGND